MSRFAISQYEIDTRRLMSEAVEASQNWDQESIRLLIAKAFIAMAHASLPAEDIIKIGQALCGYQPISENYDCQRAELIRGELTAMVRGKWLRSRRHEGRRLYEVNY
jgi:hypothetical protein